MNDTNSKKQKKLKVDKVIEKIAVPILERQGFEYIKGGRGQIWRFIRPAGDLTQEIALQRGFVHTTLSVAFRSCRYPFTVPKSINVLDRSSPLLWNFSDQETLEKTVTDMLENIEQVIVPFLNNDIHNPEANSAVYQRILEKIRRMEESNYKNSKNNDAEK